MVSDLGAIARVARTAPAQLERILEIGEEIALIGRSMLEIAERLDRRAEATMLLGERLDMRAAELVELGGAMHELGLRIDVRGAEIVDRATRVADTGDELLTALPAFERALDMATPLEGAIDRFGRLVDRLPGGRRPPGPGPDISPRPTPEPELGDASDALDERPDEPSPTHPSPNRAT